MAAEVAGRAPLDRASSAPASALSSSAERARRSRRSASGPGPGRSAARDRPASAAGRSPACAAPPPRSPPPASPGIVIDSTTGQPLRVDPAHLGHVLLAVGLAAQPAEQEGADAEIDRAVERRELRGRQDLVQLLDGGVARRRRQAGRLDRPGRELRAPWASQSAPPPCSCARPRPQTVTQGCKCTRIIRAIFALHGRNLAQRRQRPHPPIAWPRPCPYFATHFASPTFRSKPNGRRPSQQLQGPQDAEGRQPGATPTGASRRSRRRSATSPACPSRCAS